MLTGDSVGHPWVVRVRLRCGLGIAHVTSTFSLRASTGIRYSLPLHLHRVRASLKAMDQDIDRCLTALEDVCEKLRAHNAVGLTQYFIDGAERAGHDMTRVTSDTKFFIHDEPPYWQRELDPPPLKVAWLFHMIDADDLISLEPDAARLSYEERERFLRHFAPRANPMVMSSFDVQSTTGAKVRFYAS